MARFVTTYIGFNTIGRLTPTYSLTDIELVKRDLLNEFNTRLGERVMLPNFGTRIFEYLFNPLDEITRSDIRDDVEKVIEREPRVKLSEIELIEKQHTIEIQVELFFLPSETIDTLLVEFNKEDTGEN